MWCLLIKERKTENKWLKIVTEKLCSARTSNDTHTAAVIAKKRLPLLLFTL